MVCRDKYRTVCLNSEITRLRHCRATALATGRLGDAAELTRQLDELYAEHGSENISSYQMSDRGAQQ